MRVSAAAHPPLFQTEDSDIVGGHEIQPIDLDAEIRRMNGDEANDEARRLSRNSHPRTSHLAAEQILDELEGLRAEVYELVKRNPGKTAAELHRIHGSEDSRKVGRRLPELERDGLIRRCGDRHCDVTFRMATTWRIVE